LKRANATLIGAFVLGALTLAVMGIIIFGGGLFQTKHKFVLFFDSSLKGLGPGSQVTFKGVPVGEVTEIRVIIDQITGKSILPVYIEIDPSRLSTVEGQVCCVGMTPEQVMDGLISKGLRAQLQFQSLVTGRLNVDLGFYPETPIRYVGIEKRYKEIPTIPSAVENIAKRLEDIPFDRLVKSIIATVDHVDRLLASGEIEATLKELKETLKTARTAISEVTPRLKEAISSIERTSRSTEVLIKRSDERLEELSRKSLELGGQLEQLVKRTDGLLSNLEEATGPESPERYRLRKALDEIAGAARALRLLSEHLDETPDMLIRGRAKKGD